MKKRKANKDSGIFKLTIDDGYCAYTYELKTAGRYSIDELYQVVRGYVGDIRREGDQINNYKTWKK